MKDFEEINSLEDAYQLLAEIRAIKALNMDNTPMEIGDRVIPWDGSACTDVDGNKLCIVDEPFVSTTYWIIISNNERTIFATQFSDMVQDLLIVDSVSGFKVRIRKDMVKHV